MITFKDWLGLSIDERKERYEDLSDKDKFKVRQGNYYLESTKNNEGIDTNTDFMKEINQAYKHYEDYKKENTQK